MVALRDIRRRLKSVQNTKKITYAMKLVSAAKLRRAQESVTNSRAFTAALQGMLSDVLASSPADSASHPLLEPRATVKKALLVIVGGSRGLCGGYNSNINRRTLLAIRELKQNHPGVEVDCFAIGKKAVEFCKKNGLNTLKGLDSLIEDANRWPYSDICFEIEQGFLKGDYDQVSIIYTKFKSAMSQSIRCEQLLPFEAPVSTETGPSGQTLFEPSATQLFQALIPKLMQATVRLACLDAKASEHGSRMTAMDSATRNAGEIGRKLNLEYNRNRQAGITGELLDIIGAAEAVK